MKLVRKNKLITIPRLMKEEPTHLGLHDEYGNVTA